MKIPSTLAVLLVVWSLTITSTDAGQFKVLKTFAANGLEGGGPFGNGAVIGGKFYGITSSGGAGGKGTFYRINLDGTQFEKLRDFAASEGSPASLVVASERVLISSSNDSNATAPKLFIYTVGTPSWSELDFSQNAWGGSRNLEFVEGDYVYGLDGWRSIFRRNLTGGEPEELYRFPGGADGEYPYELIDGGGNVMYGLTRDSSLAKGTIFKINKDGTGYRRLHSFDNPGQLLPYRSGGPYIILLNERIFGITRRGGPAEAGYVYSIKTDGTGFTIVKNFDGKQPNVPEVIATDGTKLFIGMDYNGTPGDGEKEGGGVVAISPDGSGQQTLIRLDSSSSTGILPSGMIFSGGRLYGWNKEGGTGGVGTVWSYDPGASANPPPFTGPLYGAVTFGGSVHSVRTLPVSSKTVRSITTTVNATRMAATKLSNTLVLDRARQAGLINSISGYSIVCTDADRQLAFYAYKPGSPLVALEQIIAVVEAGVIQAPTITDVYNAALNTTKTAESGTERIYATGRFLGMDVSMRRTLIYKSAQAVINGINSTYYPGTSKGAFFGTDEAGAEFVEGTFSIAAPKAIQVPVP